MAQHIAPIKMPRHLAGLVLLLSLLPVAAVAQGFEISGECSLSDAVTLTIYDGDSTSRTFTGKVNKGLFLFTGQVAAPVLASIEHPAMARPLYFFLENSDISIHLNATKPEASLITGSRSNSEYRYVMECYRSDADPGTFLKQYVRKNAESVYVPFILHQQMSYIDDEVLRQLVGQLKGPAIHTYHYTLLRRWMRQSATLSEGAEMPNFAYIDSDKERREFASTRNTEGYTLVMFGATWCDICQQQLNRMGKLLADRQVRVLTINIDDNPNGWDAHYLKELSIDHIPYVVLVDANGVVVARDIRDGELSPRLLGR